MRVTSIRAFFLLLLALMPRIGHSAATIYLDVPAVPGLGSPQNYPTSMLLQSFTWDLEGNYFQVSRISDSNSAAFQAYALDGDVLHNVSALFYKTPNEMHDPYLTFTFQDCVVASESLSSGEDIPKETIQFSYDTRTAVYLAINGEPGVSSPPDFPNVHRLNSFTFDDSGLTITKDIDAASPALAAAVANGTNFVSADLLFYNLPAGSDDPVDPPYDIMALSNPVGISDQTIVGAGADSEQITFGYTDFNPLPEPAALWLPAAVGAAIVRRRV